MLRVLNMQKYAKAVCGVAVEKYKEFAIKPRCRFLKKKYLLFAYYPKLIYGKSK